MRDTGQRRPVVQQGEVAELFQTLVSCGVDTDRFEEFLTSVVGPCAVHRRDGTAHNLVRRLTNTGAVRHRSHACLFLLGVLVSSRCGSTTRCAPA